MLVPMLVRDATPDDWPAIWPFLHRIVAAGDTYTWGNENYVRLDPFVEPAHVFTVRSRRSGGEAADR